MASCIAAVQELLEKRSIPKPQNSPPDAARPKKTSREDPAQASGLNTASRSSTSTGKPAGDVDWVMISSSDEKKLGEKKGKKEKKTWKRKEGGSDDSTIGAADAEDTKAEKARRTAEKEAKQRR